MQNKRNQLLLEMASPTNLGLPESILKILEQIFPSTSYDANSETWRHMQGPKRKQFILGKIFTDSHLASLIQRNHGGELPHVFRHSLIAKNLMSLANASGYVSDQFNMRKKQMSGAPHLSDLDNAWKNSTDATRNELLEAAKANLSGNEPERLKVAIDFVIEQAQDLTILTFKDLKKSFKKADRALSGLNWSHDELGPVNPLSMYLGTGRTRLPGRYNFEGWTSVQVNEPNMGGDPYFEAAKHAFLSFMDTSEVYRIMNVLRSAPGAYQYFNFPSTKYTMDAALDLTARAEMRIEAIRPETEAKRKEKVVEFSDGFYWLDLDVSKCDFEAKRMGHCGTAGASSTLFSLRDDEHRPHVTVSFNKNMAEINEIKSKQNTFPQEQFWDYIEQLVKFFFESMGKQLTMNETFEEVVGGVEMDELEEFHQRVSNNNEYYETPGLAERSEAEQAFREVYEGWEENLEPGLTELVLAEAPQVDHHEGGNAAYANIWVMLMFEFPLSAFDEPTQTKFMSLVKKGEYAKGAYEAGGDRSYYPNDRADWVNNSDAAQNIMKMEFNHDNRDGWGDIREVLSHAVFENKRQIQREDFRFEGHLYLNADEERELARDTTREEWVLVLKVSYVPPAFYIEQYTDLMDKFPNTWDSYYDIKAAIIKLFVSDGNLRAPFSEDYELSGEEGQQKLKYSAGTMSSMEIWQDDDELEHFSIEGKESLGSGSDQNFYNNLTDLEISVSYETIPLFDAQMPNVYLKDTDPRIPRAKGPGERMMMSQYGRQVQRDFNGRLLDHVRYTIRAAVEVTLDNMLGRYFSTDEYESAIDNLKVFIRSGSLTERGATWILQVAFEFLPFILAGAMGKEWGNISGTSIGLSQVRAQTQRQYQLSDRAIQIMDEEEFNAEFRDRMEKFIIAFSNHYPEHFNFDIYMEGVEMVGPNKERVHYTGKNLPAAHTDWKFLNKYFKLKA